MLSEFYNLGNALINEKIFEKIELSLSRNEGVLEYYKPIFIVGAPRSGSTLVLQAITDALDIGYISNRHCQWYGAPVLAERLFRPTVNRPRSNYQSLYGVSKGAYAPSECGRRWYRFFRRKPPYVTLQEVEPLRMLAFRRSIIALSDAYKRPVLFKNLYASLRIQAIAHYLPESLFIVMHRDEIDNAQSLLEARYKRLGSYEKWFSVEPPEVNLLKKLLPHEQVIEQIRHIYATIMRDFRIGGVSSTRRFDLVYEDFCADTKKVVSSLLDFLRVNNCSVVPRGEIPTSFERRQAVRIDKELYDTLIRYAGRA